MSAPRSDVLVIGAGSAGSVVAEQLSADSSCNVTVLEAGIGLDDPALLAQVCNAAQLPIGSASPLVRRFGTELTSSPPNAAMVVRGAAVGGSGAVNGGYFCRGLPRDFDGLNLPGWAWGDVVGHYRAIEADLDFHNASHGDDGPIPVQRAREFVGSTELFVAAAGRSGFDQIADLNGDFAAAELPVGFGAVPLNIVDGVRIGPGQAYLAPALSRPNLKLLTQTRAVRVAITAGRAVAIEAVGPEGLITLAADRIVLCGGAIETAQLLMLSGIGDETMLDSAGVDVINPLPVGTHCIDHPEWVLPVDWVVAPGRPVLEVVLHTADNLEVRPYTGGFVTMVGDRVSGHPDWPHVGVALMQPRARGRLILASRDPLVPLRIEHRYDSEPADVAALRVGAELVRDMIGSTSQVGPPIWSTSQHLCGSAPMGRDGDESAVLDAQCRVRGIAGLWVIDGSILPNITSRGPHATIVMAAHRAAEFVRAG